MTKSRIFFVLSLAFIGGIGIASFYYPKTIGQLLLLILIILALILLTIFYKNKMVNIAGLAILFFVSGIYLTNGQLLKLKSLSLNGKEFSGPLMVIKEPQTKERMQTLIVQDGNKNKFLLNANAYETYNYGDNLNVNCTLSTVSNAGLDFDYQMYLAKDGVYYECKRPVIEKLGINSANYFYAALLNFKDKFNANISKIIPNPEAGLLSGLLLGGNGKLSQDWQKKFSATGMAHIVAVSGYNVAIIAEYLMVLGIFIGFWRQQAFWLAVTGIIIFIVAIGMPASAVRAGVMGILLIWAIKNGRLANSQNAVLFSASAMLLINPMLLRWDIGFQLSFLATLGIIYFYPIFENITLEKIYASFKEDKFASLKTNDKMPMVGARPVPMIMEIFFLTICAQIFVMPVILFNFQNLSLVSIPANLMILPIIPITMLLGFLAGIFGFISQYISQILAWLAYLPLKYETSVIEYLSNLEYASVEAGISWQGIILWYAILAAVIYYARKKIKKWSAENSS